MAWPFFNGTTSYRRIIVPNSGSDLWWFAVVCGGLRWFVVVCGGLWWFAVICGGLSFSHTANMNVSAKLIISLPRCLCKIDACPPPFCLLLPS